MKKLVLLLALVSLPIITMAQENDTTVSTEISIDKEVKETVESKSIKQEAKSHSFFKAKVMKLNHKKSNEIISIKAYRKSLQIKVKTVKLC